ncbi:MAG: STAS domain-containing protein [bacterium]
MGNSNNGLEIPIMKVWDNIIATAIVGSLDSERTEKLMEALLDEVDRLGARFTIIDISGVPSMDTQVAQHLLKLASALNMMGSQCILSGIRPDVAQTVVDFDIDFSAVRPQPNLASALKIALQKLGYSISSD